MPDPTHAPTVTLGHRKVGGDEPVYVIAEAGVNHNGDLATAHDLIDVAARAGADAVKFQAFKADRLVVRNAPAAEYQQQAPGGATSQYDLLARLELPDIAWPELAEHCRQVEIDFLATPFSREDLDQLRRLDPVAIKIASTDLTNLPLIDAAINTALPLILSTGAARSEEIDATVALLTQNHAESRLILLHCVSSYPTHPADANLRRIQTLARTYHCPVGYSDHTEPTTTGGLAVALGACVIEKHITLDRIQTGPDHAFSLEPDALACYIDQIRQAQWMLGNGLVLVSDCEVEVRKLSRASIVAAIDIAAGTIIRPSMLATKRPAGGIAPARIADVIDARAAVDIAADTPLTWPMIDKDGAPV